MAGLNCAGLAYADEQTAIWNGGNGSWTTKSMWSGGVVPNNTATTTFNAQIDGGKSVQSAVSFGLTNVTVDSLTIDNGDSLSGYGGVTYNNQIFVNGTLNCAGVAAPANGELDGSGTIVTGTVGDSSGTLTIGSQLTLSGGGGDYEYAPQYGAVGNPAAPLVNNGTIRADGHTFWLQGTGITNNGTLEAVNAGIIAVHLPDFTLASLGTIDCSKGGFMIAGKLENSGQNLVADSTHGNLYLYGAINGGTVTTLDGKTLYVVNTQNSTIDNVTLNGQIIAAGGLVVPAGQSVKGDADIFFPNPKSLEDFSHVAAAAGTTTISEGITIDGGTTSTTPPAGGDWGAVVGSTGQPLINHGRIRADVSGERIFLHGSTITSDGALEADDAGTLSIGGNLVVADGGQVAVGGTGLLNVTGNVDLSAPDTFLDVLPGTYSADVIMTYTGSRIGIFSTVTPGITVQYFPMGQIKINGTVLPEPQMFTLLLMGSAYGFGRRRK